MMDDRPVCVQLTPEQVSSVVKSAQVRGEAAGLAGELAELAFRQSIPPISVWEAYERAEPEFQISLAFLRGLRLLAQLVGGKLVRLDDLALDLNLSRAAASAYLQTLVVAGMVENGTEADTYRLAL